MSSPGANGIAAESRRKSGRAIKAPDKFQPEVQKELNGKRKRVAEALEEDAEQDDELDDESETGEGESTDEDAAIATKKTSKPNKKPATKKARTNGSNARGQKAPVKLASRPKKAKKVAIADPDGQGLYAQIFLDGIPAEQLASEWLRSFDTDPPVALQDLVNTVLRSAGCAVQVTEDDINDPDHIPTRLNEIQTEQKEKASVEYPLIRKGNQAFRENLTNFFTALIQTMHATEALYNAIELIENLHLWVSTMSSSSLRPFRHTATVIALVTTTALCQVAKQQSELNARALRQFDSEQKKKVPNQGRLKDYQAVLDQGRTRHKTCEGLLTDFFDTVFVHRYRDVDPHIRIECVNALGAWMHILPERYYEGSYIRYLGWLLSDTQAQTRIDVLKTLHKVLKDTSGATAMGQFIERFRPRIVEIASKDADSRVRGASIELLNVIRQAGMLEPDDIDTIGKLIFDAEPIVRKSVVGFFADNMNELYESTIEELGGAEALEDVFATDDQDHESPQLSWLKLKGLAEVFLSYDVDLNQSMSQEPLRHVEDNETRWAGQGESSFVLATQALYESVDVLHDWETIAGYLLYDHSRVTEDSSVRTDLEREVRKAFTLGEAEESVILQILYASVRTNLDNMDDEAVRKKKAKMPNARAEEAARKLAVTIPRLLKKFAATPASTSAVLRLEQVLNLRVFQALRQDSTEYTQLLHEILNQFSKHSDPQVLSEASAALLHALEYDELLEITEEQIQSLWNVTIADFRAKFPRSTAMTVRYDLDIEPLQQLGDTVLRLAKLASISNPIEAFERTPQSKGKAASRDALSTADMLLECAKRGLLEDPNPELDDTEDRLVTAANKAYMFYYMWKSRELLESLKRGEQLKDAIVEEMIGLSQEYTSALVTTFSSRADIDELRLVSVGNYLDVFVLNVVSVRQGVSHEESHKHPSSGLRALLSHVEPVIQKEITDIFAQLETKYAKKARRALEPPADDDDPEEIFSDSETEEPSTDTSRRLEILSIENQLTQLTSRIVCAILANVIDGEGRLKGKLRARIQRNRNKLGPNYKAVVAMMDPKKDTAKKSHKSKAQQEAAARKKSKEIVVEDDSEDEDADPVEDLDDEEEQQRRDIEEDVPDSPEADAEEPQPSGDEDDVLGD